MKLLSVSKNKYFLGVILILLPFILFGEIKKDCRFFAADTIHVYCTGDIMLDRNVKNFRDKNHFVYPVNQILPTLSNCDFLTGNLESMISDKGHPQDKKYNFHAEPGSIELLKLCGFDCVTVANNHAYDWHVAAFTDCMERLDKSGIDYVGGGTNYPESLRPQIYDIGNTRIAIFGFNDTRTCMAGHDLPCTAPTWGATKTLITAQTAISEAKETSDLVFVHVHWGIEDTVRPVQRQELVASCLADAGADIIFGHHPHRLQPVEFLTTDDGSQCVVFYSLGNFLFDQNDYLNNLSGIADIEIYDGNILSVSMIPIDMKTPPRAVSPADSIFSDDIFKLMKRISVTYNTKVTQENGKIRFFRE